MSSFTSMFNSALSFSMDLQAIQDSLPDHAQVAISGVKSGTTYIREGVNSKLGERRRFKTKHGIREMIELGPISDSANIIKVRCCATDVEFIMKRLEVLNPSSVSATGTQGLVSLEAMQAMALRADLVPSLPDDPNLVQCFGCQSDNSGLTPAKVLLLELCGESLADALVQAGGFMKPDQILHITRDVASGLSCLHSMEKGPVVHGSVEPKHILLDTKSATWKLGSFGATHSSMQDDPEDAASDIWQLGLLLLTLMFGVTAFDKKSQITNMNPIQVRNAMVQSIASRPINNVEGRILLLATWLLSSEPCQRPTAQQVVAAVESMGVLPAPQLALAFPAQVRKDFKALSLALVRRTILEAINAIDGSDRRALISKYGEEALQNPNSLPSSVKQDALSTQQSNFIRTLSSFLPPTGADGDSSMGPDAKKLREQLAECAQQMPAANENKSEAQMLQVQSQSTKATESPKVSQPPMDLLDFGSEDLVDFDSGEATVTEDVPKLIEADLLGSLPSATPASPAQVMEQPKSSGLDLNSLNDLFAAPMVQQAPAMVMPAVVQMPSKPAAISTAGVSEQALQNPFDMPSAKQDPFDSFSQFSTLQA